MLQFSRNFFCHRRAFQSNENGHCLHHRIQTEIIVNGQIQFAFQLTGIVGHHGGNDNGSQIQDKGGNADVFGYLEDVIKIITQHHVTGIQKIHEKFV